MHILILGDNKYQPVRMGILRAPGAHRIATHLRKRNLTVEVIDFYLDWTLEELQQAIDAQLTKPTLFIGFSCSLMFEGVENFHAIRDYIRSKNPNIPIVVGGNKTLHKGFTGADYYLEGVGEASTTALVDYLLGYTTELKTQDVDGNRVLNSLTDYKVDSVAGINISYTAGDFISKDEVMSLESARGCIFKCAFCDFPGIGKSKLDYLRDIDEILEELKENYYQHGITKYFVVEDTINDTDLKCEMLEEIGQKLPFRLELMGYMRADLLVSRPKNVQQLVNAGFKAMHFGIETFNPEAGKIIGKGMPSAKLRSGLAQIKQEHPNLFFNATFIVGLPYETRAEILEGVEWMKTSKVIDFWSYNPLMIPKTEPTIHHSYFTENYMLYGYKIMSEQEFTERSRELENTNFGLKWWKHIMPWKNQNFDFFEAAQLASEINQSSNLYRKIDAWHAWSVSAFGQPIDQLLKLQYVNGSFDGTVIEQLTKQYVNTYKTKKLNYLLTK